MLSKTAIYIRVSTASQNTDLQKDGLMDYVKKAKFVIVKEYVDIAVSERKKGRPAL